MVIGVARKDPSSKVSIEAVVGVVSSIVTDEKNREFNKDPNLRLSKETTWWPLTKSENGCLSNLNN